MSLPVFLINLDRDPDRLAHMASEFAREGLEFTRIPAVLGVAMPEWVKPYFLDGQGEIVSSLKRGEVGCYASHLVVAQRMLDEGCAHGLICEDDLRLPDGVAGLLAETLAKAPAGWDIIRLSNPVKAPYRVVAELAGGHDLVLYSRVPNNTGAYLLSASGARKLLVARVRKLPIDEHLRRPWLLGMETYGVVPAPIVSNIFDSTIDAMGDRGLSRQNWAQKLRRRHIGGPGEWIAKLGWQMRHLGIRGWLKSIAIFVLHSIVKFVSPALARRLRPSFRQIG